MPRSRGRARATRIERGLGAEAVADLRRRCPPGPVRPGAAARVGRPPSLLRHGSSRNNRAGSSEAFIAAAGVLWLGEARLGAGQGRRRRRLNEAAALPAFLLALLFGPVRRWHFTLRRPPSGRCAMDHHAIAVPSFSGTVVLLWPTARPPLPAYCASTLLLDHRPPPSGRPTRALTPTCPIAAGTPSFGRSSNILAWADSPCPAGAHGAPPQPATELARAICR